MKGASGLKLIHKMSQNKARTAHPPTTEDVVKSGYLKKLKTMKKKFFVLRRELGPDSQARLEYYDSEKKFKAGAQPKKPILLRTCISINCKKDPKHSHVMALYTSQGSHSMAAESEAELKEWLSFLHHHMHQTVVGTDGQSRKLYEHAWLVVVQPRSLASSKGISGEHYICLTYKSIALVRVGEGQKKIEFPLNSIRQCGHTGSFFYLSLGRSAVTGSGDLWMLTEDSVIAENMHSTIRNAMKYPCNNKSDDPLRPRTNSLTNQRSVDNGGEGGNRTRCVTMPSSRSRTSSEGSVQTGQKPHPNCSRQRDGCMPSPLYPHTVTRPKSMYSSSFSSCSPPCPSALFSPSSSESVESTPSVDEDHHDDHGGYMTMGECVEPRCHPRSLPITNKFHAHGLVSPVSLSSSETTPCLSSPQDTNYLPMELSTSQASSSGSGPMLSTCPDRGGYMAMDKLNSPGSAFPSWPSHCSSQVSSPPHSANHSRVSSLVDDSADCYMPAFLGHADDRANHPYLDMSLPTPIPYSPSDGMLQHRAGGDSFPEMSPGSSSSFTSGTPSSDHHFHDFLDRGVVGSFCGLGEDDDNLSLDRPIRTNSVGSKPEQFRSRKNRLEVSPAEPARVRAFSVGSRVGLKVAGGRAQAAGGHPGNNGPHTEFSPSIKEKGKQVKSKSSSAPILGTSPISKSWSGTTGTFFRSFLQARNQERNNDLMEFDFSKNKSCDSISSEKEKKSSSVESFKRSITGHRNRSNSKSSGNGKASVFDSFKRDKKKSESELSAKGMEIPEDKSAFDAPRGSLDAVDGYLPMDMTKPAAAPSEYMKMDFLKGQSPTDNYMAMSATTDRLATSLTNSTLGPSSLGSSSLGPSSLGSSSLGSSTLSTSNLGSSTLCTSTLGSSTFSTSTLGPSTLNTSTLSPSTLGTPKQGTSALGSSPVSSSSLSEPNNEYVDMTQGKGPPSSSSSSIGARVRKISSSFNPLSSQDFPSQQDEYVSVDLRGSCDSSHSLDGEKSKKKKSSKRKSFKDSKIKKSDPIAVTGKGGDSDNHESSKKGTSPLSSISNLLGRKNSSGTPPKTPLTPLSPTGSPLPKSSRGTPSPFSSLTRSKSRDKDGAKDCSSKEVSGGGSGIVTSCIRESSREAEESAITSGDGKSVATPSSTVPSNGEQLSKQSSKRTSGIFETLSQADSKHEEGRKISVSESSSNSGQHTAANDVGAYVNLAPAGSVSGGTSDKTLSVDSKQRKISTGSISDYMNLSPVSGSKSEAKGEEVEPHDYVNMSLGKGEASLTPPQPGGSTSPKRKISTGSRGDENEKRSPNLGFGGLRDQSRRERKRSNLEEVDEGGGESGYLLMTPGQPPPKPTSPMMVARRPDIPSSLLGGLERLGLGSSPGGSGERCRSHSGPGAPESSAVGGEARVKKQLSEPRGSVAGQGGGRAASACSSPVSYSPPTSPTLRGSVSSVSSLSEGGMSSASSTCTVVNVGVARREGLARDLSDVASTCSGGNGLNYVSLDLAPARCEGVMPSPRPARRHPSGGSGGAAAADDDDEPLNYAQIDFTKSEGLRTTSLARDHRH